MMSKGNARNLAGWLHICSLQLPKQFSPQSTCRIKSTLNHTREVQYLQTLNIIQYAMGQGPSDLWSSISVLISNRNIFNLGVHFQGLIRYEVINIWDELQCIACIVHPQRLFGCNSTSNLAVTIDLPCCMLLFTLKRLIVIQWPQLTL